MFGRRNNRRANHRDHRRPHRPSSDTLRQNQAFREAYHQRLNTPGMAQDEPNQTAINETARRMNDAWNQPNWDQGASLRRELRQNHITAPGLQFEDEIMIFEDGYAFNRAEVMRRELEHRMRNGQHAPLPVRLPVRYRSYQYRDFGIGEQISREPLPAFWQRRVHTPIEVTPAPDLEALLAGQRTRVNVEDLPKRAITNEDQDEHGEATCYVCQENVQPGTEVTSLPCQHWFCTDCLKPWLKYHDTCPTCRASVSGQRQERNEVEQERNEIEQDGRDLLDFLSEILSLFE